VRIAAVLLCFLSLLIGVFNYRIEESADKWSFVAHSLGLEWKASAEQANL
jgi:hypothetical protein